MDCSENREELRKEILGRVGKYFHLKPKPKFVAGKTYIPPAQQVLSEADFIGLTQVVLNGQYATGVKAHQFEKALNTWFQKSARSILVNSGSSANLLAISSLGSQAIEDPRGPLNPGERVLTVAAGFPTTVAPILQNGWVPVFVDVELDTLNTTLERLEEAYTPQCRAVVLAHTLGNPYRADLIRTWCLEKGLYLIEDCCDALGSTIGFERVGSFGEFATLSFYPAHHLSTGEGGACIPKTEAWRKIALSLRDWGRDCWCHPGKDNTCGKRFGWSGMGELPDGYDHKYIYTHWGYNLKATEFQGALGLSQLNELPYFIAMRRNNYHALSEGVKSSPVLSTHLTPVKATPGTDPSWFGFAMHCSDEIDRGTLIQFLEQKRIGCRLLFGGNLTKQPAFKNGYFFIAQDLPNTDRIMDQTFWIGLHPGIENKQISYMLEQLEAGVRRQIH